MCSLALCSHPVCVSLREYVCINIVSWMSLVGRNYLMCKRLSSDGGGKEKNGYSIKWLNVCCVKQTKISFAVTQIRWICHFVLFVTPAYPCCLRKFFCFTLTHIFVSVISMKYIYIENEKHTLTHRKRERKREWQGKSECVSAANERREKNRKKKAWNMTQWFMNKV